MPRVTPETVWRSIVLRPVTEVYVVGVAMLLLTVRDVVSLTVGILVFGMVTMLILLVSVYYELLRIERLLDSLQPDEGLDT